MTKNASSSVTTTTDEPQKKSLRGRPRSLEANRKVVEAALEVMSGQGYAHLTLDEVARRSGIPKSTMYRRWRSKGAMLAEALYGEVRKKDENVDLGSIQLDLDRFLTLVAEASLDPIICQATLGVILEAQADPGLVNILGEDLLTSRRKQLHIILMRGVERGELGKEVDLDLLAQMLLGAVWYRRITSPKHLGTAFVPTLVEMALASVSTVSVS